jgi:hypothetical protein
LNCFASNGVKTFRHGFPLGESSDESIDIDDEKISGASRRASLEAVNENGLDGE